MPPAVAAAGIGAAASIGGAVLGSKAQSKAAKQAANAEVEAARINSETAKQFRAEDTANFAPWLASGQKANALLDSFLYGPEPEAPAGSAAAPAMTTAAPEADPSFKQQLLDAWSNALGIPMSTETMTSGQQTPAPTGPAAPAMPTVNPGQVGRQGMDAYKAFQASPYYQFPLQEGMNALNQGYAGNGLLESGAAMKAISKYGQDYGAGRMMEFLGMAADQSNRGLQAGSSIAGVSQNALNNITAANQSAADARANAALISGAGKANMWSGIGSAIGTAAGSLFGGSSYGSRNILSTQPLSNFGANAFRY